MEEIIDLMAEGWCIEEISSHLLRKHGYDISGNHISVVFNRNGIPTPRYRGRYPFLSLNEVARMKKQRADGMSLIELQTYWGLCKVSIWSYLNDKRRRKLRPWGRRPIL